jgi:uncharacterized protein
LKSMEYIFLVSLLVIAFLYSSVGHGGASGYLALMALAGISPLTMKPTALTLNLFVSAIAFIAYYRAGYFKMRIILPFLLTSIPMANIGARIQIDPVAYKIILGVFLLIAVGRMLLIHNSVTEHSNKVPVIPALIIGAVLGFFSGMIGIGGGILLSPVLILMHWANIKQSAAASALFIFLNSMAGLMAVFQAGFVYESHLIGWIAAGVAGGIAGSYMGSRKIPSIKLKYVLAVILIMASAKLFIF